MSTPSLVPKDTSPVCTLASLNSTTCHSISALPAPLAFIVRLRFVLVVICACIVVVLTKHGSVPCES